MVKILQGDGKAVLAVFIGAIIAVTFMATIGDQIFPQTNTGVVNNLSVVTPANGTFTDVRGRELITLSRITNATDSKLLQGVNMRTAASATTGLLTVQVTTNDTFNGTVGETVNLTYTYIPDGYVSNSGGRAITRLILIFAALAIVVFIIVKFIQNGSMGDLIPRAVRR